MNLPSNAPWWAVLGVIILWAVDRFVVRRTEKTDSIADQWATLSSGLRQQVKDHAEDIRELKTTVGKLERENRALRIHNRALTEQVLGLGETPIPFEDYYTNTYGPDTD